MFMPAFGYWMGEIAGTAAAAIIASMAGAHLSFEIGMKMKSRALRAPSGLLLDLLLPPDRAEDMTYNLLGRYPHWVDKHGARKANIIFAAQSLGAILCFWCDWVLKRANLLRWWQSF